MAHLPTREGEQRRLEVLERLGGKITKSEAELRPAGRNTKINCAECVHFLLPGNPTSSCRRVAGVVYAETVCDLFAPRETEFGDQGSTRLQSSPNERPEEK